MINNRRIQRLKHNIKKAYAPKEFSKVVIRAKEGLFLFNLFEKPGSAERRIKIDKEIINYDVSEITNHSIDKIIVVGDGKTQPVIIVKDGPKDDEFERVKQYADKGILNYKDLSNTELMALSNI